MMHVKSIDKIDRLIFFMFTVLVKSYVQTTLGCLWLTEVDLTGSSHSIFHFYFRTF